MVNALNIAVGSKVNYACVIDSAEQGVTIVAILNIKFTCAVVTLGPLMPIIIFHNCSIQCI